MLLAALAAVGSNVAEEVIDRASGTSGRPTRVVRGPGAVVAAWPGAARASGGGPHGWVAEGWMELDPDALSPAALRRARGHFAMFALREEGVLLASGRAGGRRPIFVAWPSRDLVLACTRLSPLLALLPQRSPLDLQYVAASVVKYTPPDGATAYAAVRRVPAGEAWLCGRGGKVDRWRTDRPLVEPELRDDGHLAIRLREALTEATRRSARDADGIAVEVSGGLDSSFLLSLLVRLARDGAIPAAPEAFVYESTAPVWHDERPHVRSLERHLGIVARRVYPRDAAPFVRRTLVTDSMAAPAPALCAAGPLRAFADSYGVNVALTGLGGDEVLDGDLRLFADVAREGKLRQAVRGAARTRGVFYEGALGRIDRFLLRPMAKRLLPELVWQALGRLRRKIPRWAGPALVRQVRSEVSTLEPPPTLHESPGQRYDRMLRMSLFGFVSSIYLQEEVVGGFVVRTPFLDDDFLRFVATLPPLSLLQGGYLRGLMREAMRGLVPEDLRLRETKGHPFWFVERTIEEAGGMKVFADLVDVRLLADLGLVEPARFREYVDDVGRRPVDADFAELWRVLSVEAFLRAYAGESPAGHA